jgi:glyoxylase-like metal-dependent hydrolase (beta-lactamase superfamily II)
MLLPRRASLVSIAANLVAGSLLWASAIARAQNQPAGPQGVPENATMRVSDHVYAIIGFPNVGIVVGNHATLVVDTGMGPRNGAIALHEAQKLSNGSVLYLTTTHFHPEHASGESAFPPNTVLVRPVAQQQELEENGMRFVDLFSSRNAAYKEQLASVKSFRTPDITFDKEITLDLGGVTARLFWLGPAHTRGDELIDVEPDGTLITGDIVQSRMVPNVPDDNASVKSWVEILAKLRPLKPRFVVPDHGDLGDGSLIETDYTFLSSLQSRALELKYQGKSADEAGQTLIVEFKTKYPDWPNLNGIANLVKHIYAESQ